MRFFAALPVVFGKEWPELLEYEPLARPSQQVTSGSARFTVLTPRLVRIEWAPGDFEDRATSAVLHRALDADFTHSISDGTLLVETAELQVSYVVGEEFSADSLKVTSLNKSSAFKSWHYGQEDSGNLLGTIESLDGLGPTSLNCTEIVDLGDRYCTWGMVSRGGWAVLDDSDTWALNSSGWWVESNTDEVDLYLFAHGHDYKAALGDFIAISGKPALPPRAASGVWWTRWYNFNAEDVRKVVDDYQTRALPLDVYVLDMDWHAKFSWGGYSWDRRLFPDPADLLGYLHDQGLTTLANVHDYPGVDVFEDKHDEVAAAMGLSADCGHIPFEVCNNSNYARAVEDVITKGLHDDGVDHLWIDYHHGNSLLGGCTGVKHNPTLWTAKMRTTDPLRWGLPERGMVLARWGGLGSHRYPVGFSGDVHGLSWENLAYQPYFSWTGSNVAYGLRSHDITGPGNDYELFVRWMQWAAYSGVLRSHDRGQSAGSCNLPFPEVDGPTGTDSCSIVEAWNVPPRFFEANRKSIRTRAALVPYTYHALRQLYDTGVAPLRPMYFEYPEEDMAYKGAADGSFSQYFFGDDLLVAPVVTPSATVNGSTTADLAEKTIWLPPDSFIEQDTGILRHGDEHGTVITERVPLSETPVFVRAGAILPTRKIPRGDGRMTGLAARNYDSLVFSVFPGKHAGSRSLYEDDGQTTAYLAGSHAELLASYEVSDRKVVFNVSQSGTFEGQPKEREITLHLVNAPPAQQVVVNGMPLARRRFGGPGSWSYDGAAVTLVVEAGRLALPAEISVVFDAELGDLWQSGALSGIRGAIARGNTAKQRLDEVRKNPGEHTNQQNRGELDRLSILGDRLSVAADPKTWRATAANASIQVAAALADVHRWIKNASSVNVRRFNHVVALLESAQAGLPNGHKLLV